MKIQRIIQHTKTKKRHENRIKNTIADEYNFEKLRQITDFFWRHFETIKFISIDVYLRILLNFLLNHFLLLRDESRRHAKLSDLQLLHLENENNNNHKSVSCLLYVMNNDKINQNDRIEYAELLKHRELNLCILSVLTNYLMWRWHQFGEKFSTFKNNKNWYDIQLLIDELNASCDLQYATMLIFSFVSNNIKNIFKKISNFIQRQWIHKI